MSELCPTLDKGIATEVLQRIDDIVSDQRAAIGELETSFVRLSRLLYEAKRGAYWIARGLKSEEEYIKSVFPSSRSQYYTLISINEHLSGIPAETLEEIGRSKCEYLVRIKKSDTIVSRDWIDHAKEDDRETFKRRVKNYMETKTGSTEKPRSPHEEDKLMTFRLFGDSITVVNKAMEILSRMTGSEKNAGERLTLLCANFLSQFDEEGRGPVTGQNAFLLSSIQGLVRQLNFNEENATDRLIGIIAAAVEGNVGTKNS